MNLKKSILYQFINNYVDLKEQTWFELSHSTKELNLEKNQYLFSPQRPTSDIFFLLEGVLKTYYISENGSQIITELCSDNSITGTYDQIDPTVDQHYYCQAVIESSLLVIPGNTMKECMEKDESLIQFKDLLFKEFYLEKLEREKMLLSLSGLEKIKWITRNRANLIKRVPQYDLASYLGLSPEAYSRLKKSIK